MKKGCSEQNKYYSRMDEKGCDEQNKCVSSIHFIIEKKVGRKRNFIAK